jgi:hypothetical protein
MIYHTNIGILGVFIRFFSTRVLHLVQREKEKTRKREKEKRRKSTQ